MRLSHINVTARNKLFKFFDLVGNADFSPYVYDTLRKRDMAKYQYDQNGQFARFTQANIAVNASFSSNILEAIRNARKPPNMTNGAERGAEKKIVEEGPLPWNLNIFYNVNISQPNKFIKPKFTQSLNFMGDINVTKFWKIGVTSGYDFTNKQLSYTSLNIYRDLKCWEARIDWVTFGFRKSYSFTLNLKTSMLSDVKIPRRRDWYDNY